MAYDKVISLGATCTPTWQIRHFTDDDMLYPFDWVLTPFASLLKILENDFHNFADFGSFHLSHDRKSVVNAKYGILHHHDFPKGDDGFIVDNWQSKGLSLPRRYDSMIERWHNTLDGSNSVLFVRHQGHFDTKTWQCTGGLSAIEMDDLCIMIEKIYPGLAFDILFVTAAREQPSHKRARLADVGWGDKDWEQPSDRWKGATREWQAVLRRATESTPSAPQVLTGSKPNTQNLETIEEARRYGVFLSVVSVKPYVIYAGSDRLLNDKFSDGSRAFNQIARQLKSPVTFVVAPWWHMPSNRSLWDSLGPQIDMLINEFPGSHFVVACNTLDEVTFSKQVGLDAIHFNQNSLINPSLMSVMPEVPKIFNAIINSKMSRWKGQRLAAKIKSLALIYSRWGDGGEVYRQELQVDMPHAVFLNGPLTDYKEMNVAEALNSARVGLCLSSVEGAMFAAIEYLLCGLPVVSLESVGGRDVFFDDRFCRIVPADPNAVSVAVDELISQDIDPTFIRNETMAKFVSHHARFVDFINQQQHDAGAPMTGEQEVQRLTKVWAGMRWTDIENIDSAVRLCTQLASFPHDVEL